MLNFIYVSTIAVFTNKLSSTLAILAPNAPVIVQRSVEAIKTLPLADQPGVIQSYAKALNYVFIVGIPSGILAACGGALCRNINIKDKKMQPGGH